MANSSDVPLNEIANLAVETPPQISASEANAAPHVGDFFAVSEIRMTAIIFLFGIISMLVFYLLVKAGHGNSHVTRMFVIIILVFGTLLVVSSAFTTEQIAPVVGFFGTIAGYLLGKSERRDAQEP